MPAGTPKVNLYGGKTIVPGGSVTFNSSTTYTIPTGVKTVTLTAQGGNGNPGNPGNPAPNSGPMCAYGGGGGAGSGIRCADCCSPTWATTLAVGGCGGYGGAYQTLGGTSPWFTGMGNPGCAGTPGRTGNPGTPGNSGNPTQALSYNFPGGNLGYGGSAGTAGYGGQGGWGASVATIYRNGYYLATWGDGGYPGGGPGATNFVCANVKAMGGGGAGTVNDGAPGGSAGGVGGNVGGGQGGTKGANGNPGSASNASKAGGGGGGGAAVYFCRGYWGDTVYGAGAGGGGRAGCASCATPGSAGNPGWYDVRNSVPVSPGTSYPIVVGSPGGYVNISWNPQ